MVVVYMSVASRSDEMRAVGSFVMREVHPHKQLDMEYC